TRDNYAQMKKVSEDATVAAQKSFETAAGSFNSIRLRQIEFAQQQANAGFELVKSLSGLNNPSQAVEVTAQFWTQQAEAAAVIQKDMAQLWRKMAEDCALPFRGSINLDPFGMARRAS
ncbi:MAG: hypothetical protein FJX29_13090, partial [Alphaproteobacteria bacterium]|nr:hypothetical protein [Alphaproteobacteria bacterium]